jgi:hypothetical protein
MDVYAGALREFAIPFVHTTHFTVPDTLLGLEDSWHQQTAALERLGHLLANHPLADVNSCVYTPIPHPARFTVVLADINGPVNTSGHRQPQ